MSILDTIIANTEPRIIGENHDMNSIDAEAGAWDKAEMIKMGVNLKEQAIGRASLDMVNGRIAVMVAAGPNGEKLPWHKLGVMVAEAVTSKQAAQLASIGWEVVKVPALYTFDGQTQESADTFLIVRKDTGAELGSVGKKYKPIQNEQGFDFLDDVLAEYGARYETAGAIYGGKKVWMQARLPQQRFEVQKGDMIDAFAMFTLDHTGSEADKCFATTQRAVCANTYRLASRGNKKGISISHVGDIKVKVRDAQRALGLAVAGFEQFKDAASAMVTTPLAVEPFAHDVLDAVLEVTQAQAAMGADMLAAAVAKTEANRDLLAKQYQRQIDKRANVLDDILERYESSRCTPRGTAWAAFNSITEAADFGPLGGRQVGVNKDSRKFESVINGDADEAKQVAYQKVMLSV